MATRYAFRSPSTAHEAALMICADFAAECKRQGDMANCYRWRNVIAVERQRGRRVDYVSRPAPAWLRHSGVQLPLLPESNT